MNSVEKVIEPLDLTYYFYDKNKNQLTFDSNWQKLKESIYKEFIKITYTLTKHNIKFFVKKDKTIIIGEEESFIQKIRNYLLS